MRLITPAAIATLFFTLAARADLRPELQITLEADRQEYFIGEPVILKMAIKNISANPTKIGVGGDSRGSRAIRFVITATDEGRAKVLDPDPYPTNFGGLGGDRDLAPGATEWLPVYPMRYCLIDKAGTYTFQVGHDLLPFSDRTTPRAANPKPEDLPHGQITLRFKMPTEADAEKIVDSILSMNETSTPMVNSTRPTDDLARDLSALRLPIYLKPLQKHLAQNDPKIAAGVASIESPESTKLLIELLPSATPAVSQQIIWPLRQRVPSPPDITPMSVANFQRSQDKTGRYAALVKATWRPELAPLLRAYCVGALSKSAPAGQERGDYLEPPAYFLQMIGEKEDAPAVYRALEIALTNNAHVVGTQYLNDPQNANPLLSAAAALVARGAAPPEPSTGISAIALDLRHISGEKTYRPEHWQEKLTVLMEDTRPFLRYQALQTLNVIPEPLSPTVNQKIEPLLADSDPVVRLAAIQLIGKAQDPVLDDRLIALLRTSGDQGVLQYGNYAAQAAHLQARWLEICAARLNESDRWSIFFPPLLAALEDFNGGSSIGSPTSSDDVRRAQRLWIDFIAQHKEEIAAGKKIPLTQADPAMVPPPNAFYLKDGTRWPPQK